ncbi:ParA family protein [Candidatus Jidaibacter acanthamoebae]|nr:ParA family protein [Candidatus Jidaibacter acanthamoeba]MBA8667327.1 ParA family protein [Holosporaceae bacterium 'Namur']
MVDYNVEGITQRTMAQLANVSQSAVSRYLSTNNILPIEEGNHRNMRYNIAHVRQAIRALFDLDKKIIKKKHSFYNFKGGTGKTSICFQVACHIALMGFNVLVIDADPQAHLSVSFGLANDENLTLYDLIMGNQKPENVIHTIFNGLDCIPSNLSLTRLETEISQLPKREERLKIDLESIENNYDFIFVDTNPTISILNRNVVTYVDVLDIVCETQPYSLNGLKLLMEDLNRFWHHMRMAPKLINIIPNKYEDRTTNAAEAMTVLKMYYSEYIKENFAIRRSEDIVTSAKIGKPLALFAKKNSIAVEDITELVHYIINISC